MNLEAMLNGAIGAGIIAIVLKLIDVYSNRGKTRSEEKENVTIAAKTAVEALLQSLEFLQEENKEYKAAIDKWEEKDRQRDKEIRELQDHRDQRAKQIADLTINNDELTKQISHLTNMQRENIGEIDSLRHEREQLSSKVIDLERKINLDTQETNYLTGHVLELQKRLDEADGKYRSLKDYTLKLLSAWRAGEPPPSPPPELGDTWDKLKAVK
jgi:chromosome segregation ATPase